jgi:hypothetical protein
LHWPSPGQRPPPPPPRRYSKGRRHHPLHEVAHRAGLAEALAALDQVCGLGALDEAGLGEAEGAAKGLGEVAAGTLLGLAAGAIDARLGLAVGWAPTFLACAHGKGAPRSSTCAYRPNSRSSAPGRLPRHEAAALLLCTGLLTVAAGEASSREASTVDVCLQAVLDGVHARGPKSAPPGEAPGYGRQCNAPLWVAAQNIRGRGVKCHLPIPPAMPIYPSHLLLWQSSLCWHSTLGPQAGQWSPPPATGTRRQGCLRERSSAVLAAGPPAGACLQLAAARHSTLRPCIICVSSVSRPQATRCKDKKRHPSQRQLGALTVDPGLQSVLLAVGAVQQGAICGGEGELARR